MSICLMPAIGTITWVGDMTESNGKKFIKISVAVDDEFVNCTIFGNVAEYIGKNKVIGRKIFIESWRINKSKVKESTYYDFIINRCFVERG